MFWKSPKCVMNASLLYTAASEAEFFQAAHGEGNLFLDCTTSECERGKQDGAIYSEVNSLTFNEIYYCVEGCKEAAVCVPYCD